LLAAGLPTPRYVAAMIDGTLMIAGTIYVVFFSHNFIGPFQGFLITSACHRAGAGSCWPISRCAAGTIPTETSTTSAAGTAMCAGFRSRSWWPGPSSAGGLVTNTSASWLKWQGYLLGPFGLGGRPHLAFANLGVVVALVLTFAGWLIAGRRPVRAQESIAAPRCDRSGRGVADRDLACCH